MKHMNHLGDGSVVTNIVCWPHFFCDAPPRQLTMHIFKAESLDYRTNMEALVSSIMNTETCDLFIDYAVRNASSMFTFLDNCVLLLITINSIAWNNRVYHVSSVCIQALSVLVIPVNFK